MFQSINNNASHGIQGRNTTDTDEGVPGDQSDDEVVLSQRQDKAWETRELEMQIDEKNKKMVLNIGWSIRIYILMTGVVSNETNEGCTYVH